MSSDPGRKASRKPACRSEDSKTLRFNDDAPNLTPRRLILPSSLAGGSLSLSNKHSSFLNCLFIRPQVGGHDEKANSSTPRSEPGLWQLGTWLGQQCREGKSHYMPATPALCQEALLTEAERELSLAACDLCQISGNLGVWAGLNSSRDPFLP